VVISAALTGALTTRDQCEHIPYTPEEITEDAAAAREAGAAIAHIHARTDDGAPTFETEVYEQIHGAVRERTDIVVDVSTGAVGEPVESRLEYLRAAEPEVAALNTGSMDYAKYSESHDDFVFDMVFENPFSKIRPFLESGELEHPIHFSLIMGVLGGIPASVENLIHQVRGLPEDPTWQVIGISRDQWQLVAAALAMGGNVRVGLEDNFYLPDGGWRRTPNSSRTRPTSPRTWAASRRRPTRPARYSISGEERDSGRGVGYRRAASGSGASGGDGERWLSE
jgi:uncharacterized protein (DUF849 family)